MYRGGDPKGWSTMLITTLGSWEKSVLRGHRLIIIIQIYGQKKVDLEHVQNICIEFYCNYYIPVGHIMMTVAVTSSHAGLEMLLHRAWVTYHCQHTTGSSSCL